MREDVRSLAINTSVSVRTVKTALMMRMRMMPQSPRDQRLA
jgi:hypothetical protein